ncbi:MAG: cobalamin biosynthesis protein CobD, partial [Planctomycetota bacterium]
VAGALKVQLGGISYYEGRREFRPILGDADEQLCAEHILDATRLAAVTGILFAIFCGGVHALVRLHV